MGGATSTFSSQTAMINLSSTIVNDIQQTITIPSTGSCSLGSYIQVDIQPVTESGVRQCICTATSFTFSTPLSAQWLNFKVIQQNNKPYLRWSIDLKGNTDGLIFIYKSTNGIKYDIMDTLELSTSGTIYEDVYCDINQPQQDVYYQLGYYTTGGVLLKSQSVYYSGNTIDFLRVYPNPCDERIEVQLYSGVESVIQVEVTDVLGNVLFRKFETIQIGINHIVIHDVKELPNASYFISFKTNEFNLKQQLIVLH